MIPESSGQCGLQVEEEEMKPCILAALWECPSLLARGALTISISLPPSAVEQKRVDVVLPSYREIQASWGSAHQLASMSPSELGQSRQQNAAVLTSRQASLYFASEIIQGDF